MIKAMGEKSAPKQKAEELLLWGHKRNPGPWAAHSRTVARAAERIALKCGMDGNTAYSLGLLHDIGRYEGITGLRHVYAGYNLLNEKTYDLNARVCLTHSFPHKSIKTFTGNFDCTNDEIKAYFDNKYGMNVYELFYDEIIKNSIR